MKELMQEATQGTTEAAISQDRKTIEYTTGVNPPVFEPQQVYDLTDPEQPREWVERNRTKAQKEQDKALAQASVRMLFSTDISKLDDAGVKGLYQSVTEGVWGMPDSEGAFFGKRGSKDDFRRNVELLRQFFKGNYKLAEDPEAEEFRKKSWQEKFEYAREHESAGNALASIAGGERGASLGELVYLGAVANAQSEMAFTPSMGMPTEEQKEIGRKINYDTMTPEEKHQYEADIIGDYEKKLAKREPLFTYVRMAADLSDEGAYILAKSYNENELDVPAILNLPEDEQAKVMTTYAQMKGDLQEGKLLGLIPMDFSTGTAGDRLQMGVYGLQQSVVSLGTDLYNLAEAGTMRLYAQMALDGKKRSDFYRTWNAIERAKLYEKQNLPEADTFLGEAYQSFMENVHWIIPYGGASKVAKWGKGTAGLIAKVGHAKELKTAGKLADLKQMMNVSLFSRMSPMADGMKYADETLNRLLTSVDKYTRELQELERMRTAYGAWKGTLDSAWVVARGSAFSAFAQEYLETADAAGISREESVLTAVWVGLLNDRIEQLYVPGLESTLTKGQLKNLGMTAMRRSLQEGTFGTYAKNFMTRYLTEGVRVGVTEGWIEEPLQQLVIEHGKQVDQVEGLDEKLKALLKPSAKDLQTYLETAVEMLPASFGFGVTTVPGQLMRRRIRNRWNAHKTGLANYDEGIVGLYQREIDVKKLIEASWQEKGEEEAERQDSAPAEEEKPKPSLEGRKPKKGKRAMSNIIKARANGKAAPESQPVEEPEAQPEEPQLSEEQTAEQAGFEADYRATDALTRAREIHEAHQGGDVCAEIAQELGLDVKTAEAVVQLLDEEAEVMRFDPRARSMVDQFFQGVRINEQTISTLLPGYVNGTFEADEANGVYVAKVRIAADGGIAAGEKTIVYRRRDGVFFNPDGTLNEGELARAASRNSTLGKSYNQRIEQNGGNGLRWEELSDADRRREALILVNGRTDEAGAIAFRKKDGSEVTVRADAIINLATGRLADIGYGMGAKQATVRHETFHALWKFAKELVKPEEVKKLADALAIETREEGWENALDEAMAHQMEEYASGHYVMNAVSSRFEAFQAWAANVFGGVDANRVLNTLPSERKTDLGTILGEGTPYALEPFYNAVMQGKIGSGEMGIDKIVVPAKQTKKEATKDDELPVPGAKEEPKPEEPKPEAKPEEPKPEEPAKPAGNTMTRPAWDKGTHVVKRVERKDYKLHCRLEVVNVFDGVRTSWDADFDQANQGREMDDQKVAEIAGNLDYSKGGRVMEFTGKGAMLVAPNMNVLDGNHHTQGIREGYRQGGEKADKFREDCLAEARERGLEVSDHAAEAPVIVCIIESVETEEGKPTPTIAEIASDTNETSQEELTSFAKAMKYAQVLIKKDLIPRFKIDPETGDIMDEDAKTVKDGMRADPVGIFVQETHAKDIVKNDRLTEQGQEILRASIIAALLGDTDAETVKNMLARQKTLDMENEQRALMRMAPGLMALVNDPAKKDYDLRPDLVEALLWYQEWRDHDEEARRKAGKTKADWRAKKPDGSLKEPAALGTTWENFKGDLFSKPGPAAQIIGDLFAASQAQRSFKQDGETDTKAGAKRAQELIVRELEAYLENVYATNTDTADMFGDFTPPSKADILTTQREKNGRYSVALYHGTGADFREPSLDHVGEGTGVAAQGHGFYATDDYGWADFMGHQAQNAGIIDSLIGRRYVYQYEYDGSTENLTHWVGPNPEAAERLMKVAKDEGLQVRESFFADPDHTTGQRMERFLELAKRPDGSKLTRSEMGELFVKAGIDGTQEYCGPGMKNTYVFYNVGKLKNVHKWHGSKQLFSVGYKPRPIAPEKVAEIVEKFGVTDNIEESLWILPDGRMLKGEARTYTFGGRTVRSFGHDALTPYVVGEVKVEENAGERVENAMRDIYASGFIRMTADSAGLYIAKRPTDEQFDALYDICDKAYQRMEADGLDEMFVDVEDENFRTAFTVRYRRGTSARRMIEDLKAWYDEGIMPEGATAPRYSVGPIRNSKPLKTTEDIARFAFPHIFTSVGLDKWHALDEQISHWAIPLSDTDRPISLPLPVFKGTSAGYTSMHPREMFQATLRWQSKKVAFVRTEPVRGTTYDSADPKPSWSVDKHGIRELDDKAWMDECAKMLDLKVHSWTVIRSDGAFRDIAEPAFENAAAHRGWIMPPRGRSKFANVFYPDAGIEIKSSLVWDDYASNRDGKYPSYSVGARRAQEIRRLFAKHRPDVEPADVMQYIEEIGKYENPKKEKLAVHWLIAGSIEIPEDNYKLDKAIKTAERAKVDPFLYKNPEDIFVAFPQHLPKDPAVDPDKVPELINKTDMGHGITVYDIDEDEQTSAIIGGEEVGLPSAQLAMREIINTHWGKDASPWCLLQGNDMGGLTRDALMYWEHYNARPKRVAFRNGKLLSFMATDGGAGWGGNPLEQDWGEPIVPEEDFPERYEEYLKDKDEQDAFEPDMMPDFETWMRQNYPAELGIFKREHKPALPPEEWWDRKDTSHAGIPFEGKVEGDPYGRSAKHELRDGKAEIMGNLWRGNKQNGIYEEWTQDGQPVERSGWKNSKPDGEQIFWWEESGAMRTFAEYRDGKPVGDSLTFDEGGVPMSVRHYDENGVEDRPSRQYHNRALYSYLTPDRYGNVSESFRFWPDGGLLRYYKNDVGGHPILKSVDFRRDGNLDEVMYERPGNGGKVEAVYVEGRLQGLTVTGAKETVNVNFNTDGSVWSYTVSDSEERWPIRGGQWDNAGQQLQMIRDCHTIGYDTKGRKWDMRMPPRGSSQSYEERGAFTPEQLAAIPDEPMPKSLKELAERESVLKDIENEIRAFADEARAKGREVYEEDLRTRGFPQEPKFSMRLSRAKRIALLRPKSAIPQMEFDFYCDRKGITEQPKAEPPKEEPKGTEPPKEEAQPKAEPPKKGKRYKAAVDDANAYQQFIDRYRPLFEAAVRRGEWKPALDFAEENHMPSASNVLKQYYRDPEFDMTELAGLKVASVEDAAAILMTVRSPFVESVKAIYLDRQRKILDAKILTIGQVGRVAIGKGTVLRNMPSKTSFVILSHNHPSGNPAPSPEDKQLTMSIKKELKGTKVKLLDHIITDGDHFYSFNYQDILPVDVKTPKWEVLPAQGNFGKPFNTFDQMLDYVAAHLRDDGDCGHVIYLNRKLGIVGVRRVRSVAAFHDDGTGDRYGEWAQQASEGAESSAAESVILDLGPTLFDNGAAKKLLGTVGPWFGVKGVTIMDALCGNATAGIRSLRCEFENGKGDWQKLVPQAEETTNEDRFNYPRYSIASRKIDWEKEPDTLANVVLSTTVAHLTGQDRYPQKYLYFKAYRDRGLLDKVRPEVEKWAATHETKWFGTYLLAKYYGDLEAAKAIARHHMHQKKVSALRDMILKEPAEEDVVFEPLPVHWLYVRNDDGRRTNRIPEAYAQLLAETFGGRVDTGIVKVSDERNTGAKIKNRVGREFQFAGEPAKDAPYVIVDDVWTTGQTAVSLMEYLEKKGAKVAAITTLAVASNGSKIKPTGAQLAGVLKKGHVETVEKALEVTGVDLRKATGSELQAYIVKGKKGQWGLESWFGSASPVLPLDFKNKGGKVTRATPFDLFAHLTAEQRNFGKPTQGVFAFSTAFPHLSEMGDDQLIAAAHAVKVATKYLGRKMTLPNYDAIMKDVRKAYPALTDEDARVKTMTIQGDAVKLARKIREGLDKGVSESAILKALNDSMKPTFMGEMRNEARAGVKAGAYGAHAEEMLDRRLANTFDRAIRVQAGVDTDLFEEWAGVDFTETLWKVLHNAYAENQPAPRKPEPAIEDPEEGGGGSEGGEARDPNTYTVKELENPRTFAEYIRDLAGKYWKETKGIGKDADPWQNRIAVQFLRKTAQNVYTKLVNEITYSRSRDTAYRAIQKMDSIPTVAGLVSQMAYVGEIIHARHIREKKQELCEKLENLLKTAFGATGRFKVDKEELKRKVTAEMELRARYMRHAMWLTPDAASEEAGELSRALTAMATKYDEAERDLEQSRIYVETIRKLNILREFGGLKYKSVGEIEQALAWWEEQAAGSSADILRAFEDREERTKTAAAILAKAFFNPKMKHKIDKGFRQGMNNYLTAHMGFASLLQDMCRFAPEKDRAEAYRIIEYLGREIQKAGDRSAAEMRRHGDDFHKAVEQIYGMPFKKVMAAMNREAPEFEPFMGTKGGQPIMPTKGRAMQLLVSLRQGARKDSNYYENVKHWHREGQAAQIADLLTPQDMNMLKWIGQWYEVNRQELSDVCEALFGIGVYSEAYNYFPVRMQLQKQGLEKVEGVAWTIFPKALTPRIRNLRDFDTETDIFALWASRMEEASQWKGHAKLGLELRGIFGRSELQEVVAANHGSRVNSLMLGFVTDILAGHGAYDRTTSGIEWWSDQIRGWTALCALGGNVGVTFKQTTSIPAFGFEIGLVKTARYTVTAFTPAGMEAMKRIFASEQRKTRWQVGNTEAVKNALAKSDASWFKRAMQASMITNKVGDIVPGLVVGQGIYRDCLARGMSEENAMAQTWMLIERTQQSGRMENQTSVQRRNRLGRMLYQFLTTQQQYLQYEVRAIRQAVADPSLKNAAQVTNTILLNHLILSSLYYWMGELYKAMLGSEPPKDQIADWVVSCLLGPFASLYVLGFCSKVTLDRFLKGSWTAHGEDMMPMESFIKRTIDDAGRVIEAVFEEEKTTDDLIEELARLAAGMNPVVRDIRKVIKNQEE